MMAERRLLLSEATAKQIAADSRKLAGLPYSVDRLAAHRGGVAFEFARFELKESLAPGSTSPRQAYRLWFDGTHLSPQTPATDGGEKTIEVIDPLGLWYGRARSAYNAPHDAGSRGWALKLHEWPYWEIAWMQPAALLIRGEATDDFDAGDTAVELENVVVMQPHGGLICDQDPASGAFVVHNVTGFASSSSATVVAAWDAAAEQWQIIDAPCPS